MRIIRIPPSDYLVQSLIDKAYGSYQQVINEVPCGTIPIRGHELAYSIVHLVYDDVSKETPSVMDHKFSEIRLMTFSERRKNGMGILLPLK